MATLGFLINPIAGMGGKVGLKGTDGADILKKAKELGAEPIAQIRAEETMQLISQKKADIKWLTCSNTMGEDVLKKAGYESTKDFEVVYDAPELTNAEHTKQACLRFKEMDVELILFCGGDGTARDILDAVEKDIPLIGIPAGVKMFSAVFGVNPKATAEVVLGFSKGMYGSTEAEIMDIDEEEYRKGRLVARLFGYAKTPFEDTLIQASKSVYEGMNEESAKEAIARYVVELIKEEKDSLFILGAGSTMESIGKELGIKKTLLGVDVVKDGKLIAKDVNEQKLLELLEGGERAVIIVSVIGAQGFVFGRGNKQLSPEVLRKVGIENIRIAATPNKMSQTPKLRVDTGDFELDKMLSGYHKVITGYHEMRMVKVEGDGIPNEHQ
ncbi:MAG: ATP-NAD kinase family protein [Methanomassiliicoccales archaeon]|nr:MAG: ATP-NAD kinase family protein [Methanomassiliicoccales archaeon]